MRPRISTGVQKTITVATAMRMVGPPRGDVELAAEHEERPDEAADAHEIGHRMVVAEEVLVVAEHQ